MSSLQQNRLTVVVEKPFLSFGECPHVDYAICSYSHSSQRWNIGDRRDDHYTRILEADKAAIKKMVHCRSQKKSVLAVEPLLVIGIPPRLAMAGA